jgi:hypothetical protein
MKVALTGSIPGALTAGIMLLSKARQLGYPLQIAILGKPEVPEILGPAVVYAPVLAGCGVGRENGVGATVVIPGPPGRPLLVSLAPHGVEGWFEVDRQGNGAHPASQALVRMSRDPRQQARHLGKELRRAMATLGMSPDPAVLDVMFGAPVPPLLRLQVALRAGRALSGGRGEPVTRLLSGTLGGTNDPIPETMTDQEFLAAYDAGALRWIFDGLSPGIRDRAEEWLDAAIQLSKEDGCRDLVLARCLTELASHLVQLPRDCILPPLQAGEDSVAVGLKSALTAEGSGDPGRELLQMFTFLGGRFSEVEEHTLQVCDAPIPTDDLGRLVWFCAMVRQGRKDADALWGQIFDPLQ